MKAPENALFAHYAQDPIVQSLVDLCKQNQVLHLEGLVGAMKPLLIGAVSSHLLDRPHLIICNDEQQATYLKADLQTICPDFQILLFPSTYKSRFSFDQTINANVVLRTEVLASLAQASQGTLIVTYPDAIAEKVITKKSLVAGSLTISKGEKIDVEFIRQYLLTYDFLPEEFVYQAGDFSIRGGIIDVFSFGNPHPFRIELFGDQVESIRIFSVDDQLSKQEVERFVLVPNTDRRQLTEHLTSLLAYLPKQTQVWIADWQSCIEATALLHDKATQYFEKLSAQTGQTTIIQNPALSHLTACELADDLAERGIISFERKIAQANQTVHFQGAGQPQSNKDFHLLAQHLESLNLQGYQCYIVSDVAKQLDRIADIFAQIAPHVLYQSLNFSVYQGFLDKERKLAVFTDHQIFERFYRTEAQAKVSKSKAITLAELKKLQPGDFVTHIDHGIGKFAGLQTIEVKGHLQEAIRLIYRDNDVLYVSVHSLSKIAKYSGKDGAVPQMNKLGSQEWEKKKSRVKSRVKEMAKELITLYAKRKTVVGHACQPDNYMQIALESSFAYEDTPDQAKASAEVKADMEKPYPMDRLVCGDVGFGKTEIAIRAAFKAAAEGKQVAVLVPTTVLAMQHFKTFSERLAQMPCKVEWLSRFRSAKETKQVLQGLKEGTVDIVIGTHKLVGSEVEFKDLGLLIIDEEQKFGVKTKEKLKEYRVNIDVLCLTATPIPRTLHFSLLGARDLSVISTPPPNRQPISTEVHAFDYEIIRDAVSYELRRGGQVFFVHNRIADIEQIADILLRLVPDARITTAHGQMDGKKLEQKMLEFIRGDYDVLVSTNIIEAGLDISNANTIIINQAQNFGLSDLHQMRGRVGRSNKKAYCYLIVPSFVGLPIDARKRLETLEEFSDIGDGFHVAMRDLDIRGAGDLLGGEQSGFVNDLGIDTYHQILDQAVSELKSEEFADLFELSTQNLAALVGQTVIETDFEILIPEQYVSSISERLKLYTDADKVSTEAELLQFQTQIIDRFGPMPTQVQQLLLTVRLRWYAQQLGFEKIALKDGQMVCTFAQQLKESFYQSAVFAAILAYVQKNPKQTRLKEGRQRLTLTFDPVKKLTRALEIFEQIHILPN